MSEITKSHSFREDDKTITTVSCYPDGSIRIMQTIEDGETVSIRCSPEGSESLRSIFCHRDNI